MKTKAIQIRNVPEPIHRRLKVRAAACGKSLSEYLLHEIRWLAERPTPEEMLARLKSRDPVTLSRPVAEIIAEERLRR